MEWPPGAAADIQVTSKQSAVPLRLRGAGAHRCSAQVSLTAEHAAHNRARCGRRTSAVTPRGPTPAGPGLAVSLERKIRWRTAVGLEGFSWSCGSCRGRALASRTSSAVDLSRHIREHAGGPAGGLPALSRPCGPAPGHAVPVAPCFKSFSGVRLCVPHCPVHRQHLIARRTLLGLSGSLAGFLSASPSPHVPEGPGQRSWSCPQTDASSSSPGSLSPSRGAASVCASVGLGCQTLEAPLLAGPA